MADSRIKPDPPDPRGKPPTKLRRGGPKHAADEPPRKRAPRKAAAKPTSSAPTSSAPRSPMFGITGVRARELRDMSPITAVPFNRSAEKAEDRVRKLGAEGHEYAVRQAMRAGGGRPSVTGRAASGAAAGAATGATIGSLVPGLGTGVGAATGTVVGAAGGGLSGAKAKRAYKAAMRTSPGARRALVAEFGICVVILALSPMTDKRRDEPPATWMKRFTAILGLFFLLGLISAGGRSMTRVAAGFGALVTVALAVSERDLFTRIATAFRSDTGAPATGTGPPDSAGTTLGSEVGSVVSEFAP